MQQEREGRVLKSLFFNNLPTDPAEPDLGDRGGDPRAVIKDIPGEDQVSLKLVNKWTGVLNQH